MGKVEVNIWEINKHTKKGEVIVVPGKVLGDGVLEHPIKIAAKAFSESAKEKIVKAGGKIITLEEAKKSKARLMK
ncbi:MAG: 50S ribosomal protein L18e [Candidatus Diapherotrites archaeon]|nr:50S ribosomal protein L18e [Candidatus Diapherotrites archaeon]